MKRRLHNEGSTMAGERTVVKGIVLRVSDNKETDRVLTVLTAEMGKITVVAKGARSRRSKVGAVAQLLAYSEMVLSESHGWQYLTEGSVIELFDGVRDDVERLSLASYFAELVEWVSGDDSESHLLLSHLLNALYALGTLYRPQALVKAAFEMRLMALIGFEPLFDGCAACGREQPEDPVVDLVGGTLLCRCCAGNCRMVHLTTGALAAIRYVLYGDPRRLYSFTLQDADQRCFSRAAEQYMRAMLDRDFHTLSFYKSLVAYQIPENLKTNSINQSD